MKFKPFIADGLLKQAPTFGVPVQPTLFPEMQWPLTFALRLHHASQLHYDLRMRILETLFSLVLLGPPSLDPKRPVKAKLMGDHNPKYLESERRIPAGQPGAGPTMPVDRGGFIPRMGTYSTYELEALDQIARGELVFDLSGDHLKGGWRLFQQSVDMWNFQKLDDSHARSNQILTLDRSINTGKTLSEL